jgi:predicted lipid-binding transport protein (Tim44 family)
MKRIWPYLRWLNARLRGLWARISERAGARPIPIRPYFAPLLGIILLLAAAAVEARVGGGHSFSGGRGGGFRGGGGGFGGGGGGGGGDLFYLLFYYPQIGIPILVLVIAIIIYAQYQKSQTPESYSSGDTDEIYPATPLAPYGPSRSGALSPQTCFDRLRQYDPNFSEISFTDFTYALYGRVHEARGRGDLNDFSSYLSEAALGSLSPRPPAIKDVEGVIVGGTGILSVSDPDAGAEVTIAVRYEANYTEVDASDRQESYYVVERWTFTRRREVLSPAPEQITAIHCPRCGGALDKKPDGSCAYCGVKITGGDFHWYVQTIVELEREARGPQLTQDVPEEGTDLPTVYQPDFHAARQQFMQANPDFNWPRTEERYHLIFAELQSAWSSLQWEKARPYETDNVFQMHRYWIEAYRRQNLRNALEDVNVEEIVPVKVRSDAFYDALTTRIFASMRDYTVDAADNVVCGARGRKRRFSEYWTFIRRRGAKENQRANDSCPNCGAPLKINMAGTCEYCGGKITSGDFDWVLSRIEQDEAYAG